MSNKKDFQTQNDATKKLLNDSQEVNFPYYLEYSGLKVRVDKGVFSPKHFEGWKIFNEYFPPFLGKTILELGTGTGITSLYLAREGAKKVVAVDINKKAVENSKKNIALNNIKNMEVRYSDLFAENKNYISFYIAKPCQRLTKNKYLL